MEVLASQEEFGRFQLFIYFLINLINLLMTLQKIFGQNDPKEIGAVIWKE